MPLSLKLNLGEINNTQEEQAMNNSIITTPDKNKIIKNQSNLQTIPESFGEKDESMNKIKRKFAANWSGKEMGVSLEFYKNKKQGLFTKIFTYNKNESDIIEEKIMQEVYYQKEFYKMRKTCNFNMPKLIQYGELYTDEPNKKRYYILMEFIQHELITKSLHSHSQNCQNLETKVKTINSCLEQNNLYHNDLHHENIMVDADDNITIIDFGEASNKLASLKEISLCKMGGKTKSTSKTKKSTSKTKKSTSKTKKSTSKTKKKK